MKSDLVQLLRVGSIVYIDNIRIYEVPNMLPPILTDLTNLNRWETFGRPFMTIRSTNERTRERM